MNFIPQPKRPVLCGTIYCVRVKPLACSPMACWRCRACASKKRCRSMGRILTKRSTLSNSALTAGSALTSAILWGATPCYVSKNRALISAGWDYTWRARHRSAQAMPSTVWGILPPANVRKRVVPKPKKRSNASCPAARSAMSPPARLATVWAKR